MSATLADCGCECVPNPDPCQPCAAGSYDLQCRVRTGSASLCGFPEWTDPSTPPKFYKKATIAGTTTSITEYFGPTTWTSSGSGSITKNPAAACAEVGVVNHTFSTETTIPPATDSGEDTHTSIEPTTYANAHNAFGPGNEVTTTTRTVKKARLQGTGQSGEISSTLGQEDTEEAAMARVAAEWSGWGSGGLCCTGKNFRGPGEVTFGFTEAEYRIRVGGTPGSLINIELTFTRTDGAPYTETRQFVAQGPIPANPSEGWQTFTVTASAGKQTCLSSSRIVTP